MDFGIIPTFLTIPYGKTAGTYTLPIFDDTINEPDESLTMTIASAIAGTVGTPSVVSTLIDDNDPSIVSFQSTSLSVKEGKAITVTVVLDLPAEAEVIVPVTLQYTDAPAAKASDFTISAQQFVIPQGQTSASISFQAIDDGIDEANQYLRLRLGTPSNGAVVVNDPSGSKVEIVDVNLPPIAYFASTIASQAEFINKAYNIVPVTVRLSQPSEQSTFVNVSLGGTATGEFVSNIDTIASEYSIYDLKSSNGVHYVGFAPGSTQATFHIRLFNDDLVEPTETAIVRLEATSTTTLSTETGYPSRFTLNILDDDGHVVNFHTAGTTVIEGPQSLTIMAGLDKPAPAGGLILPITVGGTATPFVDSSAGNIPGGNAYVMIFTAGSTLSSTKVAIYDDQILEKTETVTLTLGVGNTTAVLGVNRSFVLSIRDNELRRAYWSTPSSSKYEPSGTATMTVVLDEPASQTITIPLTLSGTATSGDYTAPATTVTFIDGQQSAVVSVPLQNDSELEWNESLVLSLGTPVNAILDPARIVHTLIINDDERAVSFTTSQVSTTEGVTASVIVALSGRVPEALTIPLIWTYASAVAVDVGSLRPPSRFPPRHRLPR